MTIPFFESVEHMSTILRRDGCTRCYLGEQEEEHGPVVFRGNPLSRRMIIGEALGKQEVFLNSPFSGPAGILLDRIFATVGFDTNRDWYLGNIIKCRPIAELGSGKQNETPRKVCTDSCKPYIQREIELINPRVVVLQGKTAAATLLGRPYSSQSMGELTGRWITIPEYPGINFFVMYHAAALLHASNTNIETYERYRVATREHIADLRARIDRNGW